MSEGVSFVRILIIIIMMMMMIIIIIIVIIIIIIIIIYKQYQVVYTQVTVSIVGCSFLRPTHQI